MLQTYVPLLIWYHTHALCHNVFGWHPSISNMPLLIWHRTRKMCCITSRRRTNNFCILYTTLKPKKYSQRSTIRRWERAVPTITYGPVIPPLFCIRINNKREALTGVIFWIKWKCVNEIKERVWAISPKSKKECNKNPWNNQKRPI